MTNISATIYFDTEKSEYFNFNWSRAVPYSVKASQDSPTFREHIGIWSEILSFLGQECLNMRKVCSFFLRPEFQALYVNSPIVTGPRFGSFWRALERRSELLTNQSISSDYWNSNIRNDIELPLILNRIHRLTALPELRFQIDQFVDKPWLPLVQDLYHGNSSFDCGYVLNQQCFPNLERLKLFSAPEFLNLDFITHLTHTKLKRLELKFCNKQPIDLNMFGHLLKAFPLLESLVIQCDQNPLTDVLDLEPNSLLNLKEFESTGIHWTGPNLSNFLSAARYLRVLEITHELTIKGTFKQLEAGDFPHLEKVSCNNTDLDLEDMLCLLNAALRLKEFNWTSAGSAEVNQIVPKDASFPQIERVLLVPASQKRDGTVFWELVEKMPNLETLSMSNAHLTSDIIDYRSAKAYSALRYMRLSDSEIPTAYFTALLNHAIHLKDLLINGGHIKLLYNQLQKNALHALESLWMQSVKITEREMREILKKAKNIENLTFRQSVLLKDMGASFDLEVASLPKLRSFESTESWRKNDCFNQEQVVSLLNAAPNLEKIEIPDRYLFALNLFETGALLNLRYVMFLYKSVTPEVRARLIELIRRVAPNVTIDKSNG